MKTTPPQLLRFVMRLPDGTVEQLPLIASIHVPVTPGARYAIVDAATGLAPHGVVVKRSGHALVAEVPDEGGEKQVVEITGFYDRSDVAFLPEAHLEGSTLSGAEVLPSTPPQQATDADHAVIWQAGDQGHGGLGTEGMAGLGALGLVGLALGGGGGGGGGAAAIVNVVTGTVVAGPVVAENGLSVAVYRADGVTLLGETKVDADGTFRLEIGDYTGVVIARVIDADGAADYLDEATGAEKDLNATLASMQVVSEPNSTVVMNINALTTLAFLAAQDAAGAGPLTQAQVESANQALATLAGVPDLHDTAVVPVNGGGFDSADGLSAGELYGALLAAFSGADLANGGDTQQTLDQILAGLDLHDGTATLGAAAQAILANGAQLAGLDAATMATLIGLVDTYAPDISSGASAGTLAENSGAGQVVYQAAATDADAVRYSIKEGGDAAQFTIDETTGEVTLIGDPDHETKSSYTFTVVATDAAGNAGEQAVTLQIGDLDEVAPVITSGATATAIAENSGAGQVVYTVVADDTADTSGGVSYSLKAGGDAALFTIDETTGQVTLAGNPDHETQSGYTFTVVATDAAGHATEQAVTLAVNNLDEVAPAITSGASAGAIAENSGGGQVVYTVTSTDSADASNGVTYSLKAGGDAALFTVDAGSGEVTLTGNPDYEAKSGYSFTVVATDAAGNATEQAVTLAVGNVDEVAPAITSGAAATGMAENSGAGQVVYTVVADDAADTSSGVSYSLKAGGDAALFTIDGTTGQVTLTGDPDYEAKPNYTFTVVATDAAGNATEQAVTLAIGNTDEVAPTITSGATAAAIDENAGPGQVVYTVVADDTADTSGGVTYSLKAGGDAALFTIDAATGAVTLTGNPDYEAKSGYAFTVVATDAAGHATEQAVTLAVNDFDESAPVITSGPTAAALAENSGPGQVVYTVTSTDTGDTSGGVSYSLKAAGDAALFSVDETTGAVTLTGDPDYETQSSYSFTVVATDAAGHATEQAVTLAVNDVDEVAPSITSGATASAIDENSGAGQVVYTVLADDTADTSGGVTYSLKAGGDAALFSIDASTGTVTLTGNPDYETQSSYSFTVVATDAASHATEQAVTLAVNNLDEVAPTITSSGTATAIAENSGTGQVVYTVVADDTADTSGGVSYSLKAGGDAALFSIDSATGAVTLTGNPDYETKSSYSFTVVATDAASHATEQAVTLAVNNLDEVAPTITSSATATAIAENSGAGQVIYTVVADDTADTSGGVTYSLKAGGDAALFSIDAATGAVTLTGNPDYETKSSYSFTVVATDAASHATEQAVTLAVNNLDEVAPTITSGATATAIAENGGAGQVVYTVVADDTADTSGGVSYSLKAGGDAALFSIDSATGAVTLTGNPDYETKSSYSFTVVATDAASHATEQAVTLAVNNLDEVAPTITSGATATAIAENSGAGKVVYTVVADDSADTSGGVSYSLKAGGDAALFSIDSATGAVTLTGNPDYETKSSYSFTVVATDAASHATEQAVTLTVNNLDEVAPTITSAATATAIAENSGAGQVVYTVVADDTADTSGGVTYSLKTGGDAALFSIDAATGAVTLTGNPDYETKPSYTFTVVATDAASHATEQAVTLAVNNLDEVAPTITSGATATAIAENSGAGQVVYTVVADDTADTSGGVSYSLKAGGDAALFSIDSSTGAVTPTGNPDYETKSSYSFTVVATDAASHATEQAVTLAVNNLDEVAPTITSGATATAIAENSGASQVVYTVVADDTADTSGGVTYSLKAGGDAALFSIDASTGAVTLTGNPDYETKPSYSFTVVAADAASHATEQAVTLAVNNLDEVAPTITSGATATAIAENSGTGQVVYTVVADDTADTSGGVSYSLKAGGDAALFSIDASTGAVTLTGNPDYETEPSYSFTVVATDAASHATEQAVTLAIDNLDEVAPTITSGATATAIAENSGAGQVVYTVVADDTADTSGGVSYSLKAGGDAALFSIDAATGAVTLTGNPDYETKSSYSFTVVATDAASHATEQAVTLAINDIADETAPTVDTVAVASATGSLHSTLNAGDVVTVNVTMSEAVTVDTTSGTPTIALQVGGSTVDAQYVSGSGSSTLSFQYTVQAGDTDANGIAIGADALHADGATLRDAAGNAADLTHGAVADNASYLVDTTAPALTGSSPANDATDVAVDNSIVLTFGESVYAGTGDIVISNGTDTRTISVSDATQVSISGSQVTITPSTDLEAGSTYSVQVASGVLTDAAGNAHAGIAAGAYDFQTVPLTDTSVVVFDLVEGVSSAHSGRTFQDGVAYTIYVRVDSESSLLSTDGVGPVAGSNWGTWTGGDKLGADDRIVLAGTGSEIRGLDGRTATSFYVGDTYIAWGPSVASVAEWSSAGHLIRYGGSSPFNTYPGTGIGGTYTAPLWAGSWASNPNGSEARPQVYLTTMPAGVLHSQGLA